MATRPKKRFCALLRAFQPKGTERKRASFEGQKRDDNRITSGRRARLTGYTALASRSWSGRQSCNRWGGRGGRVASSRQQGCDPRIFPLLVHGLPERAGVQGRLVRQASSSRVGNATGISVFLEAKRFELLHELLPKAKTNHRGPFSDPGHFLFWA